MVEEEASRLVVVEEEEASRLVVVEEEEASGHDAARAAVENLG